MGQGKKVGHRGGGPLPTSFKILLALVTLIKGTHSLSFRHSEGLNRWSFLSPNQQHDLYSDLLCPNPMVGGSDSRVLSSSKTYPNGSVYVKGDNSPVPNDIWALKTTKEITFLPCDLKQYASFNKQHSSRFNSSSSIQNQILFMNISLTRLNFSGAKLCNKVIKLQFDEEDGVELSCDESPLRTENAVNHIHWPTNTPRKAKSFSIFKNLERFLQNEETLRTTFYFHIYFTSFIHGRSRKCTVQQYELNLSNPGCNVKRPRIEDVCGEYSCDDLIFPYYAEEKRQKVFKSHGGAKSFGSEGHSYSSTYDGEFSNNHNNNSSTVFQASKPFYKRLDVRSVVFITILPIVLIGMLVFGLEIVIYLTCLRGSRTAGDGGRDHHILQNSLNLWESIPNREIRSVSFSPVTTNIDNLDGSESPLPDPHSTPRVLKSALKKSTEHLPPPPPSFFEHDKEHPPTYVEAMKH